MMPLLQLFLSILFAIAFFIALFVVAWYIALPLLMIWGIASLIYWIRLRIWAHQNEKAANGCSIRIHRQKPTFATIIDVDYTELDN